MVPIQNTNNIISWMALLLLHIPNAWPHSWMALLHIMIHVPSPSATADAVLRSKMLQTTQAGCTKHVPQCYLTAYAAIILGLNFAIAHCSRAIWFAVISMQHWSGK